MSAAVQASLRVTKVMRARPERLFQAWTDPQQLAQWWHLQGAGWSFLDATVDLREGGAYRLGMTGPDGKAYVASGEYRVVRPPTSLAFTWHWQLAGAGGPEMLVTVEFNRIAEDETEVVLTHTQISSQETKIGFESGWNQLLIVLNNYLRSLP